MEEKNRGIPMEEEMAKSERLVPSVESIVFSLEMPGYDDTQARVELAEAWENHGTENWNDGTRAVASKAVETLERHRDREQSLLDAIKLACPTPEGLHEFKARAFDAFAAGDQDATDEAIAYAKMVSDGIIAKRYEETKVVNIVTEEEAASTAPDLNVSLGHHALGETIIGKKVLPSADEISKIKAEYIKPYEFDKIGPANPEPQIDIIDKFTYSSPIEPIVGSYLEPFPKEKIMDGFDDLKGQLFDSPVGYPNFDEKVADFELKDELPYLPKLPYSDYSS